MNASSLTRQVSAALSQERAVNASPILSGKDSLPADTLAEIKRLGATKAIILGGVGVISKKVEAQLKSNGLTFERVAGSTRYETSVKAAKRLEKRFLSR